MYVRTSIGIFNSDCEHHCITWHLGKYHTVGIFGHVKYFGYFIQSVKHLNCLYVKNVVQSSYSPMAVSIILIDMVTTNPTIYGHIQNTYMYCHSNIPCTYILYSMYTWRFKVHSLSIDAYTVVTINEDSHIYILRKNPDAQKY